MRFIGKERNENENGIPHGQSKCQGHRRIWCQGKSRWASYHMESMKWWNLHQTSKLGWNTSPLLSLSALLSILSLHCHLVSVVLVALLSLHLHVAFVDLHQHHSSFFKYNLKKKTIDSIQNFIIYYYLLLNYSKFASNKI